MYDKDPVCTCIYISWIMEEAKKVFFAGPGCVVEPDKKVTRKITNQIRFILSIIPCMKSSENKRGFITLHSKYYVKRGKIVSAGLFPILTLKTTL